MFDFFSRAENLETITPPFLRFEIVSPTPIEMRAGTTIDYRLLLRGLPLRWRSEISVWEPEHRFVDRQIRGPYRKWVHEHRFEDTESGTRCTDTVRFAVLGGRPVVALFVRADLRRVFEYRYRVLGERFGSPPFDPRTLEIGRCVR